MNAPSGALRDPGALLLVDAADLADLDVFVSRAKTADPGGAIRLQVVGDVLVSTVCVVPGAGLMGEGTVLGMRAQRLASAAGQASPGAGGAGGTGVVDGPPVDVVVDLAAVADRLARMRRTSDLELGVPPAPRVEPWAGLTPPRTGWEPVGEVSATRLAEVGSAGIVEVATGAPTGSGAAAVADLRRRVWGRMTEVDGITLPAGAAYGALCLGFVRAATDAAAGDSTNAAEASVSGSRGPGDAPVVRVARHGRWTRLSARGGYVLSR